MFGTLRRHTQDLTEEEHEDPALPADVVAYLSGRGMQLLTTIKTMSYTVHTFDAEPPLGSLLIHLVSRMVDDAVERGACHVCVVLT